MYSTQGTGLAAEVPPGVAVRVGGVVAFLASYGFALAVPVTGGFRDGREWLAAPLVGPPVALARQVAPPWGLTLDEIGQVLGVALIVAGDRVSWSSTSNLAPTLEACPGPGLCLRQRF